MADVIKLLVLVCMQAAVMEAATLTAKSESLLPETTDTCGTCTQMFDRLKDLLGDPKVQDMIKNDLLLVCKSLHNPSIVKICSDQVEKNLPIAFTLVDSFMNPSVVCSALGLCVVGEDETTLQDLVARLETTIKSPNSVELNFNLECKFCIYLLELLEGLLPREKTESAIAQVLERLCDVVPPPIRHQCQSFIEQYSKKLIEMLLGQTSPHTICNLLHFCKGAPLNTLGSGSHMRGYACASSSYKCQSFLTALECGAVDFCQEFIW